MHPTSPDQEFLSGLTVLLVEDDTEVLEQMSRFLGRRVGRLLVAENGSKGLGLFAGQRPDLVVTDIMMPIMDGLTMAEHIRAMTPGIPIIVITAFGQTDYLIKAINLGIDRYVVKPIQGEQLEAALLACAHTLRREQELSLSRRRKLELLQAQHEATLGTLAAGLAHDYSNLLQGIMTSVSLARRCLDRPEEARRFMDLAQEGWKEAQELGQRLGHLHLRRDHHRRRGSLEPLLRATVCKALEVTGCGLHYDVPEDLPEARFDPVQMERVFSVLAQNAAEAMPAGGTLHLQGGVRRVEEEEHLPLVPGEHLHLRFTDEGRGIPADLLPMLFMPYTTTKGRGQSRGTGLSLALAQAYLKLHKGALLAESPPGHGATFHLYLPLDGPRP